MRILFHVRNPKNAIRFESLFHLWAEAGNQVHLVLEPAPRSHSVTAELTSSHPNLTYGHPPAMDSNGPRVRLSGGLRSAIDYLFFQHPEFAGASSVLERAGDSTSRPVKRLARAPFLRAPVGRRAMRGLLQAVERRVPGPEEIGDFIRKLEPDVFLVSPVLLVRTDRKGLSQLDYLRAAKRLGIPTGLLVASWDNLTTKGLIHELPDFMTVWNEGMKREAVELHGMPPERVLVTGAPSLDDLFAWTPQRSREDLCAEAGLSPERPYLLYTCSSKFVTQSKESRFVKSWVEALRGSGIAELREVQVLVRPYPGSADLWRGVDLGREEGVSVWPFLPTGKALGPAALSDLRHSIYHSAAVVGANTSALIESAVIGRTPYSILAPELRQAQEGTLHFSLISEFAGGLVNAAVSFEEHAEQLRRALRGEDEAEREERRLRFLEAFVRPNGLHRPAAEALAEAIEAAAR